MVPLRTPVRWVVFPALAGMNRTGNSGRVANHVFPALAGMNRHKLFNELVHVVFPALAGMNRHATLSARSSFSVPRARGDEPPSARIATFENGCSPRSRG